MRGGLLILPFAVLCNLSAFQSSKFDFWKTTINNQALKTHHTCFSKFVTLLNLFPKIRKKFATIEFFGSLAANALKNQCEKGDLPLDRLQLYGGGSAATSCGEVSIRFSSAWLSLWSPSLPSSLSFFLSSQPICLPFFKIGVF